MKKLMFYMLPFLLVVSLFGCANNEETGDLPEILIGSDTYPPHLYFDNNGNPTGIDVDIAAEAFKRLGYEATFINIDWEKKKELVESGEIDCIWGCFSMEGREDDYKWAGPYMYSKQVIAVANNSSIFSYADLAGKMIAVQSTTKPEEIILNDVDNKFPDSLKVLSMEDRSVQYAALDCGYVDAIAAHKAAILQYMKDYNSDFRFLEETLLSTGIGVAFSKYDDRGINTALNGVLKDMKEDGTLEKIISQYLGDASSYLEDTHEK